MIDTFVLSRRAARDIVQIRTNSLRTWGEEQTLVYLQDLERRLNWLVDHPTAGKQRDEIRIGLRSFPQGKHIIFYRLGSTAIEIAGIAHQHQDVDQFFTNS
jgi:toxin ParE1/3/4